MAQPGFNIMVWMLTMNRGYSTAEYDVVYHAVGECFPLKDAPEMKYEPNNPDSFRMLATRLLPLLLMFKGRVPRGHWIDHVTKRGKHWIELVGYLGERTPYGVGYHLSFKNSLCGIAIAQGQSEAVANIGLGIKQIKVEPDGILVEEYFSRLHHKLTLFEINSILGNTDDVVLKRLNMILTLKEAYLNAVGSPLSTELFSRMEFDIPNQRVSGDGNDLPGWEFRIFVASVGVARGSKIVEEQYECACAMFTGASETRFIFHDTSESLSKWVHFGNLDDLFSIIPQFHS
ncbi:hypothetical protein NLJ89_g8476 [Agrocybe chaxingu]|uniref:holo-[acyl-carrier-protein] synthase n=1 Tax=Agrocybe chaxingu TaxID=84603 RepID=A0A9W8JXE8_9AGAR|nr:hypothetical protein NLJ89_g8476 [Agrocybe chaxingu]